MKKEFKAPVVEAKELAAQDSIMAGGIMLMSAEKTPVGVSVTDDAVSGYNIWKGYKEQ